MHWQVVDDIIFDDFLVTYAHTVHFTVSIGTLRVILRKLRQQDCRGALSSSVEHSAVV